MKLNLEQKDKLTTWAGAAFGTTFISTSGDISLEDVFRWLETADLKQIMFGVALWIAYYALYKRDA